MKEIRQPLWTSDISKVWNTILWPTHNRTRAHTYKHTNFHKYPEAWKHDPSEPSAHTHTHTQSCGLDWVSFFVPRDIKSNGEG